MPMSWRFHCLLLAVTCLSVYGTPVHLPNVNNTQEISCEGRCARSVATTGSTLISQEEFTPSDAEHVTGLMLNVGAGGGTDPHGIPKGTDPMTQEENGDSLDRIFGLSEFYGEAVSQRRMVKKIESTSETGDPESKKDANVNSEHLSATGGGEQPDFDMSTPKWTEGGLTASSTSPPQLDASYSQKSKQDGDDSIQEGDPSVNLPSFTEPSNVYTSLWNPKLSSQSPIPPLMFVTSQTSTPLINLGHDRATMSSVSDTILPEIGPSMMPREDGLESLWTEAARPNGADTAFPLPQDEPIEATMSSEALPLIFEPVEDATVEGEAAAAPVAHMPSAIQPPAAMATRGIPLLELDLDQLVTVETDREGPSPDPPVLLPDWTSSWQTSGAELLEPISSSGSSLAQRQVKTDPEDHMENAAARTSTPEENIPSMDHSRKSNQQAMTTVTMETHQWEHNSRGGIEEMESKEEAEEEEEDENSEESVEEESEEDLTESPKTSSTQPPYGLIPPPPVWVQRNQGLSMSTSVRSWVELIREKAGYVSGMLAPVGIGITGALLIVGALYSIRMIHRKRRNSFKHQRRKVRQPEQPREPSTSRQDQAMLLADSSEDEF